MFEKIKYSLMCILVVLVIASSTAYGYVENTNGNQGGSSYDLNTPSKILTGIKINEDLSYSTKITELTVTALYSDSSSKLLDNNDVTWTSDNKDVAIVSNGLVVFIGNNGEVTITAQYNEFKATVKTTVNNKILTDIKINEDLSYFTEITKLTVTALYSDGSSKLLDNNNITWTSDNKDVAVVNNGSVAFTGNYGTVNIAARYAGKSAIKQVVIEKPVVEKISIGKIAYSNEPIDLEITRYYSDGSKQKISEGVEWISSNSSVATVTSNNKLVFTNVDGTTELQAEYNGFLDKVDINVKTEKIKFNKQKIIYDGFHDQELKVIQVINGVEIDITKDVKMHSNNKNVVMIGENNNLIFKNNGRATIIASYNNFTIMVNIVVERISEQEVKEEIKELEYMLEDIEKEIDEIREVDELKEEAEEKQNKATEIIESIDKIKHMQGISLKIEELDKIKEEIDKLEEDIDDIYDDNYIKEIEIEGCFEYSEDDVELELKVDYLDGRIRNVSRGVKWKSENKDRATVDKHGRVTFTGEEGWVTISAKYKGKRDAIKTEVEFDEEESKGKRYSNRELQTMCEPINYPLRFLEPGEIIVSSESVQSQKNEEEYINIKDTNIKNIKIIGNLNPALVCNVFNVDINYKNGSKETIGMNDVKWTSSNKKVATITDDGVIVFTGKAGHLKITAEYKGYKSTIEDNIHSFDYYFK